MRHEQGAAHAADGYARATGKVGVCMATSGPGATNLVTGIANAYLDSVPMVALTGQVARPFIGKDAFQEIDITGITLPITKHNYLAMDTGSLAQIIKEAFYLARHRPARPGAHRYTQGCHARSRRNSSIRTRLTCPAIKCRPRDIPPSSKTPPS